MDITASFRDTTLAPTDFEASLGRMFPVVQVLAAKNAAHAPGNWRLKGDTLKDALRYEVFEADGQPKPAALAVLKEEYRGKKASSTHASIWNGDTETEAGASMSCQVMPPVFPHRLSLLIRDPACVARAADVLDILRAVVLAYRPAAIQVAPAGYFEHQTFKDRVAVGWMLYLPLSVTAEQVPQAAALEAVKDAEGKQIGTIIVSVTDEAFALNDAAHLEQAHQIEAQLVDRGLLPAFQDL